MDNNTIKIKLKIADFAHPMTIDRSKEEVYRAAAKLVDRRFLNYKERYKSVNDDNMILSFVALDFALQLLTERQNKDVDQLKEKIEGITQELEIFLKNR